MTGSIAALSRVALPDAVLQLAPDGPRRAAWLAGRVLLSRIADPASLTEMDYGTHGKPAFRDPSLPRFNLSHSGDRIALLVSDEGEVGCDIEVIRPRKNWPRLAEAVFSADERREIDNAPEDGRLATFWQVWTRKEAILKQSSGSVWQLTHATPELSPQTFIRQWRLTPDLWLTVCTPTPCPLTRDEIDVL